MSKKNLAGNIVLDGLLNKADELKRNIDKHKNAKNKYTPQYIEGERQKAIKTLKDYRGKLYEGRIAGLQEGLEKIKSKYAKNDEDSTESLLKLNRTQNIIKGCSDKELEAKVNDYSAGQTFDVDTCNILAAELRGRGMGDRADILKEHMQSNNTDEPYKNDAEYKEIEKEIADTKAEQVHEDMLLFEDGSHMNMEDLLKGQ